MADATIDTSDVRGAFILATEGFWHPNPGYEFDVWLGMLLREAVAGATAEAEAYLDQCVERLENVDIATMRALLRGAARSDADRDH